MSQKMSVTEIRVRMDCNGCVQKIKKALHGVAGICELYVDFPQQKVTVIGWADPVKIVKAIKKTRKSAVICSHTEQSDEASQPESEPEPGPEPESEPEQGGGAVPPMPPPPESTEQPQKDAAAVQPAETGSEDAAAPAAPPSQPHSPSSEPETSNETRSESIHHAKPQNVEEIHIIYRHPPDSGTRYAYGHYPQQGNGGISWNTYPNEPPLQPIQVTQSYNTYRASPHVTEYARPGQMQPPPPPPPSSHYSVPEQYSRVYAQVPGEPPQSPQPQPIHYYNRNTAYSSGAETPRPPQKPHYYGGQWNMNAHPSSSQLRTEPSHPSQTIHYYSGNNSSSSNSGQWNGYPTHSLQPSHTNQSYNMYMPSPYTTDYAQNPQSTQGYSRYTAPDNYNHVYYNGNNGHISSMFSEENPNACTIA